MKPDTTVYRGRRSKGYAAVTVDDLPLSDDPSLKLANHSPTGFEWSYYGSGPAQLALAILLDFTGDPDLALDCYQLFKAAFVGGWPQAGWEIDGAMIRGWLEQNAALAEVKEETT
ncbi:MAG TPA: DUF6166 domain-containing protein [Tepidisphaeraceae bacterium]|jgi:hypothetical protein|nr:DUF6166 domain-containing protein [Tepidisphaeraceae bacterium]